MGVQHALDLVEYDRLQVYSFLLCAGCKDMLRAGYNSSILDNHFHFESVNKVD